jgi:hypothetical protein
MYRIFDPAKKNRHMFIYGILVSGYRFGIFLIFKPDPNRKK